jgi:hypothetical protein
METWCIRCNSQINHTNKFLAIAKLSCGHDGAVCEHCDGYGFHRCYACRWDKKFEPNAQPRHKCLMCNKSYGVPYASADNYDTIKARCGCRGVGVDCASPSTSPYSCAANKPCKISLFANDCHACRTPRLSPPTTTTSVAASMAQLHVYCAELSRAADALAHALAATSADK